VEVKVVLAFLLPGADHHMELSKREEVSVGGSPVLAGGGEMGPQIP
jgi:hypothetical protein